LPQLQSSVPETPSLSLWFLLISRPQLKQ
jgi:hypothetical protein